jgi:hypothetical protein
MSLEKGDLTRLVHNELHIDEFQSKLGENKDVIVVSFKVAGKEPAADIGGFVEKGYEWVLDSDVSAGEMGDGDYIVFVEIPRDQDAPQNIIDMMSDLMNLTEQDLSEWRVRYYHDSQDNPLDKETLARLIPLSPEEYEQKYGRREIDQLKSAAGVKVDTKAPKNDFTESLRVAAGIK